MSEDRGIFSSDSTGLESLKPLVEAAVELAEEFPPEYRGAIITGILQTQRLEGPRLKKATSRSGAARERGGDESPLARVADAVAAPLDVLQRLFVIDDDGEVQIRGRIDGRSIAERQNRYSAVYAFVREKALGEVDTDLERLRRLCERQACYNAPNFTRNFRTKGFLREYGAKGTSQKRYRLSSKGEAVAEQLIRELAGADEAQK